MTECEKCGRKIYASRLSPGRTTCSYCQKAAARAISGARRLARESADAARAKRASERVKKREERQRLLSASGYLYPLPAADPVDLAGVSRISGVSKSTVARAIRGESVSMAALGRVLRAMETDRSFHDDTPGDLVATLPLSGVSGSFPTPHDHLVAKTERELVRALLGTVSDFEFRVLSYRFGLDGEEERTLRDIGFMYGLSRERVLQIQETAINRMRLTFERWLRHGVRHGANGVYRRPGGTWLAVTSTRAREFVTEKGARSWFSRMGGSDECSGVDLSRWVDDGWF